MFRINQVKLPIDFDKTCLTDYLSAKLKVSKSRFFNVSLSKLSIDARDKSDLCYKAGIIFDIDGNFDINKYKNIEIYNDPVFEDRKWQGERKHIVIVGSGPSGLFAGLRLAESGAKVTIIERGFEMSKRQKAVDDMMNNSILSSISNIQFGEGGAGTFSDGKLNTGIKSKYISYVLKTFHKFGSNENILYDARPHIGTDVLAKVIVNMRKHLEDLGVDVLFEHKLIDLKLDNDKLSNIIVQTPNGNKSIDCDILILAIGHSSRDTIRMLYSKNLQLKQKPFSMGFRIEHLQEDINLSQYGNSENAKLLPPADYHLVEHVGDRVLYSFCMCPGGVVVPAMSEEETIVTNGMSYCARDCINGNSALLVSVNTNDFGSDDVLAGIELQEKYEKFAYLKTNNYLATVQRLGDFLKGQPSTKLGKVKPSFKPGYVLGSVEDMLPKFIIDTMKIGIPKFSKKLKCFDDPDAILTGVETRSSAPYQFIRGLDMQSSINDVYTIGEGAGFAGGIVSSAVEGCKCADVLINKSFDKI